MNNEIQYGIPEYFRPGATDQEILRKIPGKIRKLIREAKQAERQMNGRINMDSLTIIYKNSNLIGGPLENRAVIGLKFRMETPCDETEEAKV